jgi:hypothetical protein
MSTEEVMAGLAAEGARRCGYSGGDPERWVKGPCDCKYLPSWAHPLGIAGSEQTGCCEMRAAWRVLNGERP